MSDKPCYLRDKCRGPSYHICLEGKEDTFPKLLGLLPKPKPVTRTVRDPKTRVHRLKDEIRDEAVQMYKTGEHGALAIAKHLGVSRTLVMRALYEAVEKGDLVMRKRGQTVTRYPRENNSL